MRSIGYCLCLVSLASVGCADLLGLGDLTYDRGEQDDSPSPVPSPMTGDGDVPCCGGNPSIGEDFPASFDGSAVWAASPDEGGEPQYWVYEASTETLSSFVLRLGSEDLLGHQNWPFDGTLQMMAVVPRAQANALVGYDPVGATVSQVTGADGFGSLERLDDGAGTSGRTALLPAFTGSEWVVLTYSKSDGSYRYFRPLPADSAVFSGEWEKGWTSIVRFSVEGQHGVMKHNRQTKHLAFDRFGSYGNALEQVGSMELPFDASIVTVFSVEGQHLLLFYQEGTGHVVTADLTLGEQTSNQGGAAGSSELILTTVEEGVLRGDVSQIVTLSHAEGPFAISFSSRSGRATLSSLSPLDAGGPAVVR